MNISHIISIAKILTDLYVIRQNVRLKNVDIIYNFFSSERVLTEHKETCLKINVKQTLKLKSGSIKFKNYFKLLAVPFKIYADFECNIKA